MAIKDELAKEVKEEGGGQDELDALDALEKEAAEFNKDAEIDRILKAFKLDAYAILDLQPGVPESEIKITYRKKSLLIHPDKTTNPSAPEAFDRLKKAQTELMDDKARARLDEAIADARTLLMRERKLTVDSPEVKEPDAEFRAAWKKQTVLVLVDNEHRRRKQLKAQMQEEGREQKRVDEETEARKRKRDHEVAWEQTREGRIDSWRSFQKGKGTVGPGKGGAAAAAAAAAGAGAVAGGQGSDGKKKKPKLKVLG